MVHEKVVFDAEPLLALLADEPGSDRVEEYFREVQTGAVDASVSPIQLTEVSYIGHQLNADGVEAYIKQIQAFMTIVQVDEDVWRQAVFYKMIGHSLGDSYALATAEVQNAVLIVGADDDFDDVPVEIERIRDEPT